MQPPRRRQPQPRAGPAKRHAFVGNDPEIAVPGNLVAHRRGVDGCIGLQVLMTLANQRQQLLQTDELLKKGITVTGQMPHAHKLDKTQLVATLQAILQQRHDLVQVLPAQRHHIDLDLDPGLARPLHAVEHGRQVAATGNAAECFRVEGIQGNVDASDARVQQQRQLARKQLAIGRQADIVQTELTDLTHERFELGADQRLAAGNAQALDACRFDQVSNPAHHRFSRQLILRRHQPFAVGHTVSAGVVAGRRQTDTQIAKTSALAINDHG